MLHDVTPKNWVVTLYRVTIHNIIRSLRGTVKLQSFRMERSLSDIFNTLEHIRLTVERVKRAIVLQPFNLTKKKHKRLSEFLNEAVSVANVLLSKRNSNRLMDLHGAMYSTIKQTSKLNSQIIIDIERQVVRCKGNRVKNVTVKFNVPRNSKTFSSKSLDFVELGIYPRDRIAVPIARNKNWDRYQSLIKEGWKCKTYGLTHNMQIIAYLSKDDCVPVPRESVIGVDVNAKSFAVTVMNGDGKTLKQTYIGKDIWIRRKRIFERKDKLKSYADKGSENARKKFTAIRRKEKNFTKNRIGEVVRDITRMAQEYNADIAIENLKRFPKSRSKKINRQVMNIPFARFKRNLESRCFDKGIQIHAVDPWHTSKFCPNCGAVGDGHSKDNYSLFVCKECGRVVNSDRNASMNIAIKCLLERRGSLNQKISRLSSRRGFVNNLVRPRDVGKFGAVHHDFSPDGKLTGFNHE